MSSKLNKIKRNRKKGREKSNFSSEAGSEQQQYRIQQMLKTKNNKHNLIVMAMA